MTYVEQLVLLKTDDHKLRTALTLLDKATEKCSSDELQLLHDMGKLPHGCMEFLKGLRKS